MPFEQLLMKKFDTISKIPYRHVRAREKQQWDETGRVHVNNGYGLWSMTISSFGSGGNWLIDSFKMRLSLLRWLNGQFEFCVWSESSHLSMYFSIWLETWSRAMRSHSMIHLMSNLAYSSYENLVWIAIQISVNGIWFGSNFVRSWSIVRWWAKVGRVNGEAKNFMQKR